VTLLVVSFANCAESVGVTVRAEDRVVRVTWKDGVADFPFLWLRDNDPSNFHPHTMERMFDLLSVPLNVGVVRAAVGTEDEDNSLRLDWNDNAVSRIPLPWLRAHRPGKGRVDSAAVPPRPWRAPDFFELPRASAAALLDDPVALRTWLVATKRDGFSVVEGVGSDAGAGVAIGERVGFLRRTNFGTTFEVKSVVDPNNLAYTALGLPLHTDLPNQELPPGYQFLHVLENNADGGESIFCDGFAVAEALRQRDPDAFLRLASTPIPFRFYDREYDIRSRKPVIVCEADGTVTEIVFNAHIADILDLPTEEVEPYYRAYALFMKLTRDPTFRVEFKVQAGDMVVFNNRRILHGRDGFNPATGVRHLIGFYVDQGELDSRLRILAR